MTKPAATRSGSETRRRNRQVNVRLSEAEWSAASEAAQRRGVTVSELLRRAHFRPIAQWTWTAERCDPTPIYDAVVADLGAPA